MTTARKSKAWERGYAINTCPLHNCSNSILQFFWGFRELLLYFTSGNEINTLTHSDNRHVWWVSLSSHVFKDWPIRMAAGWSCDAWLWRLDSRRSCFDVLRSTLKCLENMQCNNSIQCSISQPADIRAWKLFRGRSVMCPEYSKWGLFSILQHKFVGSKLN